MNSGELWRQTKTNLSALSRLTRPQLKPDPGFHVKILEIYEISSRKFATQNDIYQLYQSKRAVILTETKFVKYKVFAYEILWNADCRKMARSYRDGQIYFLLSKTSQALWDMGSRVLMALGFGGDG